LHEFHFGLIQNQLSLVQLSRRTILK